MNQMSGVAV